MRQLFFCIAVALLAASVRADEDRQLDCSSSGADDLQDCEFQDGSLFIKSVKLVKESSVGLCISGVTFGVSLSDHSIWVAGGCSGKFAVVAEEGKFKNYCSGNGMKLYQFNGKRKEDTTMPCKYHAVRQTCGQCDINITPGNIYRYPRYYLDTLWFSADCQDGIHYEGRTTNKISAKFFTGLSKELFNVRPESNIASADFFDYGKDDRTTWAEPKDKSFRVSFTPWDPDSTKFKTSEFRFDCFDPDFEPAPFSEQLCGGWGKTEVKDQAKEMGLKDSFQVMLYEVFSKTEIEQTFEGCIEAEDLYNDYCDEAGRLDVAQTCSMILNSNPHTKCVTKYSCHPIYPFLDCVKFVCSKDADKDACYRLADATDLCREFPGGNLTARIDAAKCYKDYIPLDKKDQPKQG